MEKGIHSTVQNILHVHHARREDRPHLLNVQTQLTLLVSFPVDDSGLVNPRSAGLANTCIMMENLDFNQGDLLPLGGTPTTYLKECCDLCRAEPGLHNCCRHKQENMLCNLLTEYMCADCKGWTRTFDGQCYLKASINTPSICQHCEASGLVDGRGKSI